MNKRPVNLDLSTVKFNITALASITHRVSGVVLLGGILILLWMLGLSLESEQGFAELKEYLAMPLVKIIVWAILAALAFHFVAGVRHMIMDLGFGESLSVGKATATITFVSSGVLILLAGVWVW
ncbi:MAG: succinate dehydrogenase / fumarate reductase cytochrome b subunit [Flavobacteriales bacterium]